MADGLDAFTIVFDTNVYISAALHGRTAETMMQLASARQITLITSEAILGELDEKLRSKLEWPEVQVSLLLQTIRDLVEIVDPNSPSTSSQMMRTITESLNAPYPLKQD